MAVVPSETSKHIILAENLTKIYAAGRIQVAAVSGVSLAVEPGEFVAIVGPSGSGKSTLFYLLGGLTRATEGRVVIDGVDFAALSDAERTRLRKHRIGFVFQKFNLLPTLSAMGNIEIAYEVSGRASGPNGVPMDRQYLDHLSDMLAIKGRLDHRPAELSGGEQQRVAIARALSAASHCAGRRADRQPGHEDFRCRAADASPVEPGAGPDHSDDYAQSGGGGYRRSNLNHAGRADCGGSSRNEPGGAPVACRFDPSKPSFER
jgi:putative ABC transport system ATP-binding protein